MICDDPFVKYIKGLGYNVLRVPTVLYEPYRLLESDGRSKLRIVGSLERDTVSDLGDTPPAVHCDIEMADVSFTKTRRLHGSAGVPIITTLLQSMGMPVDLSAEFTSSSSFRLSLRSVRSDR